MYGELIPLGGGDTIPLLKKHLLVGRRESCDIVLRFANVSAHHCELNVDGGYLYVRDLQSRNGVKVNGVRVQQKRLDPGDHFSIAKHNYRVQYSPAELGAVGPPPADDMTREVLKESLLARAGLERGPAHESDDGEATPKRYDPTNMKSGQIKLPDQPL
jgi:adenylate cyclase